MIYTDGIHLVADSLPELHDYAERMNIKRSYFEGLRNGHPHYDIPKRKLSKILEDERVMRVDSKRLLKISKSLV